MSKRYNLNLNTYSQLKKGTVILKWYLNIIVLIISLFWIDYEFLPTQQTSDTIISKVPGDPNSHFTTKQNFSFLLPPKFPITEEVNLYYAPLFKTVKIISFSKIKGRYPNYNDSQLILHFSLFLIFAGARSYVGSKPVVKTFPLIKIVLVTIIFLVIDLIFLFL